MQRCMSVADIDMLVVTISRDLRCLSLYRDEDSSGAILFLDVLNKTLQSDISGTETAALMWKKG